MKLTGGEAPANLPMNFIICDPYKRYPEENLDRLKGMGYTVVKLDELPFLEGDPSLTETYYAILEEVQPRMHLDKGFAVVVNTSREKDDVYFNEFYKFFKQVVTAIAADLIPYETLQDSCGNSTKHSYAQYRVISV